MRPFGDDFPEINYDSRVRSRREVVISFTQMNIPTSNWNCTHYQKITQQGHVGMPLAICVGFCVLQHWRSICAGYLTWQWKITGELQIIFPGVSWAKNLEVFMTWICTWLGVPVCPSRGMYFSQVNGGWDSEKWLIDPLDLVRFSGETPHSPSTVLNKMACGMTSITSSCSQERSKANLDALHCSSFLAGLTNL